VSNSRRRRVSVLHPPASGVLLRWGREESWGDPDLCMAWAPGAKAVALRLGSILHAHREELEAAGMDVTTLRLTVGMKEEVR
jgi:hypothetical protein